MKRTINLMDVKITDINEVEYNEEQMKTIVKQAANMIFKKADSYEMLDYGKGFHNLEPVKINEDEAAKIKDIIRNPQEGFLFFVSAPICAYIDEEFKKPLKPRPSKIENDEPIGPMVIKEKEGGV